MELSIIKGPKLVVALDIGSTYSGYAWQERSEFETNRSEIHFNTNWGAGALQLHKTTTCILIECQKNEDKTSYIREGQRQEDTISFPYGIVRNGNDEIKIKIGHEAERAYSVRAKRQQDTHELAGHCYFFNRFKLQLYNTGFHREQLVEDQIGQQLPLFDVMSSFIKALKDHCLKKLETNGLNVELSKTLFVVTVPAIWSDEAKKFMRDATVEAGIGKKNVLLALEPEAAAINCLHLPEDQRKEMNELGMKGQKFLVADLGGGTADLSAVEVEENGFLKEICQPLGDPVGGQRINDAFLQVCHDNFKGDGWKETFSKVTPLEMLKMEADFERKKVTIGAEDPEGQMIELEVPPLVRDKLEDKTILLKENNYLKFEDRELVFDSSLIRDKLFKETCNVIYTTIGKVLNNEKAKGLKTVVLVGGFAESPIVVGNIRQMIAKDFPDVKVVVPSSPFKAVLKGAVLFGQDPMIFRSRISRDTFGIQTNRVFDAKIHDETKRWKNEKDRTSYCKHIFVVHVRKGQSVVLGSKQPVEIYQPMNTDQTELTLPIYTSSSPNPKYTDEKGCKEIGKIKIDMRDTKGRTDRKVEVTMIYGGTELSIIAKDKASGKEYNADINFNHM
ncbi:heat shock 70 kDa protein 12B-like [Mercenaria mercenaria]|uniref:heat shock 70 kDa protein 12B-like n=1 Tax=Mercenaria mercenaria TaxID=6596 RepID=UPI00234F893D|nr:heat shock 70 kDa protein 12B-like [Mercenaria mercenaria]